MTTYQATLALTPSSWPAKPYCPTWFNASTGGYGEQPITYPGVFNVGISSGGKFLISYFIVASIVSGSTPPTITSDLSSTTHLFVGQTLSLSVSASGSVPLTFTWYKGISVVLTDGPTIATTSTYNLETNRQISDTGATYHCVVSNGTAPNATSTTTTLTVTTSDVAPTITSDLSSNTYLLVGDTLSLSVTASGTTPFTFTWYKGSSVVWTDTPGTSTSTYNTETNRQISDTGATYHCVVSNGVAPNATSTTTTLTVTASGIAPTITTDISSAVSVVAGDTLTLHVVATGSPTLTYKWYKNGLDIFNYTDTHTETNKLESDTGATYYCVVHNSFAPDATSTTATLTVTARAIVSIAINNSINLHRINDYIQLTATATWSSGPTSDVTNTATWTAADVSPGACVTIGAGGMAYATPYQGTTWISASQSGITSNDCLVNTDGTYVASIAVSPNPCFVGIGNTTAGTPFTAIGTWSDSYSKNITSTTVWASDNAAVATMPLYSKGNNLATGVGIGSCTVSANTGWYGDHLMSGTATLNCIAGIPPSIVNQPVNQTIYEHQTTAFSITSSGLGTISYKWYTGPNSSTLTETSPTVNSSVYSKVDTPLSQNGTKYWCLVTNEAGSVLSNSATLTVNAQLSVTVTLAATTYHTYTDLASVGFYVVLSPFLPSSGFVATYYRAHGSSGAWIEINAIGVGASNSTNCPVLVNGSTPTQNIPYGDWDIRATYFDGAGIYAQTNSNVIEFIGEAPSSKTTPSMSLTSSNLSATVGTPITLTATLPTDATGTVEFFKEASTGAGYVSLGAAVAVGSPSAGLATFNTTQPTGSTWTFKAAYSGNTPYYATNATLAFGGTITKTNTSITVTSDTPGNSGFCAEYPSAFLATTTYFHAKLTPASILSPAPSGDLVFTATNSDTSESISLATVALSSGTIAGDGSITLSIGSYAFRGATNLGSMELGYGHWTITASYSTDSYYNASTSGLAYTAKMGISTTITTSAGQYPTYTIPTTTSITLTATLHHYDISESTPTPTGTVNFYAQEYNPNTSLLVGSIVTLATGRTLSGTVATYDTDFSALGEAVWSITASYSGDGIYTYTNSYAVAVNVLNSGLQIWQDTTAISSDESNGYASCQQASMTVTITPVPISGTLTIHNTVLFGGTLYTGLYGFDLTFTGSNTQSTFYIIQSLYAGENSVTSGQNIGYGYYDFWATYTGGNKLGGGTIPVLASVDKYLDVIQT